MDFKTEDICKHRPYRRFIEVVRAVGIVKHHFSHSYESHNMRMLQLELVNIQQGLSKHIRKLDRQEAGGAGV